MRPGLRWPGGFLMDGGTLKDYDLRPTEPMLEPEKWERVLNEVWSTHVRLMSVKGLM